MARVRRNTNLGSREARRRLMARAEPYWLVIERGLSLGYRKTIEGGAWLVRRYDGARRRHIESRMGTADDFRESDGADVLDFAQAQRKVLAEAHLAAVQASGRFYTVADAISDYVDFLRAHRKSADETASKLRAYVLPILGGKRLADLTPDDFDGWVKWALNRQRGLRKKSGSAPTSKAVAEPVKQTQTPNDPDVRERQRRRKVTLNRIIGSFKACLNHAANSGKVPSRAAWERLRKFRSVDSARMRWLTVAEAKRLQNASSPELRLLINAALLTGCRLSELLNACAGDFDPHSETLLIAESKSGQPRRVPLTEEGVALFERLTAGKSNDTSLFRRADGSRWYRMALLRAMNDACVGGRISPPATFHTLRHTYASHLVQNGVPLLFVASALGHRDARMVEKHYGHLAPSQVAEMIRKKLPSFGRGEPTNVRSIQRKR